MTNPTAQLTQAEKNLVAAIDGVATALEAIATTELDRSLARLHTAAADCKERLSDGKASLFAAIADVVGELGCFEAELLPPTPPQLTVVTAANDQIEPATSRRKRGPKQS